MKNKSVRYLNNYTYALFETFDHRLQVVKLKSKMIVFDTFFVWQDLFVKMGQTLRLDSMLTSGSQFLRESKNATKSPWEPTCVYANFPHQVLCGDSWGNFAMLLGTTAGTFLVSLNTRTSVRLFQWFSTDIICLRRNVFYF